MTPADKPDLPPAWGSAIKDAGDGHIDLYSAEQVLQLLADERRNARAELIAEMKPVAWMTAMTEYPKPRFVLGSKDPSEIWAAAYMPLAIIPDTKEKP